MPYSFRHVVEVITCRLTRFGRAAVRLSVFLAVLFAVAPSYAGATAPPPEGTGTAQVTLTVINRSKVEICYLYLAPAGRDDWGADRLGAGDTIAPGNSYAVRLTAGKYDVRAEDCDGDVLGEVRGVDIDTDRKWTVTGAKPVGDDAGDEATGDEVAATPTAPPPVVLDQFLCCGQSVGGTLVWSIRYPRGWEVEYFGTQREFVGAAVYDPSGSIRITFLPSGMPEAGGPLDTGEIESFLDALVEVRQGEDPGFEEFLREPVPGLPDMRLWGGTWPGRSEKMWETYLVLVGPLTYVAPQVPQTYMTLMGVRAASPDWAAGVKIYEDILASAKVKAVQSGDETDAVGMGQPAVEAGMVRFCPRECEWEWISAAVDGWACPVYGEPSSPYEVPCERSEQ